MSTNTKRFIGYTGLIWAVLFFTALIPLAIMTHASVDSLPAVANAEPAPWWQQVEQFQTLALKWIAALTAVVAALATLVSIALTKYTDFRERLNRISARVDTIQGQAVTATATQVASNTDTASKISSLQNQNPPAP